MGRERKVGHDKLLTRQHCLTPPLGTTSATLWFGLASRFARGLPICSMRPPFITTTRPANVMAGLLKELTTGLWSCFTRWEAFGIADANSAVTSPHRP